MSWRAAAAAAGGDIAGTAAHTSGGDRGMEGDWAAASIGPPREAANRSAHWRWSLCRSLSRNWPGGRAAQSPSTEGQLRPAPDLVPICRWCWLNSSSMRTSRDISPSPSNVDADTNSSLGRAPAGVRLWATSSQFPRRRRSRHSSSPRSGIRVWRRPLAGR